MKMDYGDLSDLAGLNNGSPNGDEGCEGCDGSGIRWPAGPSCPLPDLPAGWVVVERCDSCERFPDDLAAAAVVCGQSKWLQCESGGFHAVGLPRAAVNVAATSAER
jgi:hypothetical protein